MIIDHHLATRLAFYGQPLRVPKAAAIFQCGETADGVYIIRTGQVEVILKNRLGNAVWSRGLSDHAILGLSAALGGHCHCGSAVAMENTEIIFLTADELRKLVREDPQIGLEVVVAISQEIRDVRSKIQMLTGGQRSQ